MQTFKIIFSTLIVAALAWDAFDELRYMRDGVTDTGTITKQNIEFTGYSNSQTEGTRPMFRGEHIYSFQVDGRQYQGKFNAGAQVTIGDQISIQYIRESPETSRAVKWSRFQQVMCWILGIILLGSMWWISFINRTESNELETQTSR